MVDFRLTEEQIALQEMAREFALKELRPNAAKYDESDEFPWEIMKKAFEVGFLTSSIPQEYGGGGLSTLDTVIICEELAWGCAGMYTSIMANSLALTPIILFGNDEQKRKFFTSFTKEMGFASFALTEREAGSDAGGIATTAKKANGEYIINGSKCFITNGGVSKLSVVFATVDRTRGPRGITAFIVPMDTPGVKIGKIENKMGHRASNTAEIFFDDVKIPEENLLGKEGMGFLVAMKTLDKARPSVGAGGLGIARAAYEHALEYSKTRKQFEKPIASFQHIAFKLSEMATEINAARHLVYHSAWLLDNGLKATKEAAMAKLFATDVAMKITVDALQIFGGYGYMKDYPMEKLVRDAKLMQIYEGTNEIQKYVISREILGPLK
ncbi:MAG: acyl-CoA dehydrogenase family protein [Acidobacteriota bacterium]